MSVRIDPITGDVVLLATDRTRRPIFKHNGRSTSKSASQHVDPFAEGNEDMTGPELFAISDDPDRVSNTPNWKVRVVPNKYPIVPNHEVIIHSPDARKDLNRLSLRQVERVVEAYINRVSFLQRKGQVFLYCNHGPTAGASIAHPHSQVMALPVLPPILRQKVEAVTAHYHRHGQCLYCQLIDREIKIKSRLVWQNEHFVLICPEASGWPYQLCLLPKIHQAQITSVKAATRPQDNQVRALAEALQVMTGLYADTLDKADYNFWLHGAKDAFFHWHMEMVLRTKKLAGVELGAGLMVNDTITPEDAAKMFRQHLKG